MTAPPFHSGYVSIVGRPNVGKSTLLNSILKEKVSIISDKPQTTRTRVLGVKQTKNCQFVFFDTPGIHKPKYKMNQRMVQSARSTLTEVDLIYLVADATDAHNFMRKGSSGRGGDQFIIELLKMIKTPVFLVLNKIDLVRKEKTLPLVQDFIERFSFKEVVPVSAAKGINIEKLLSLSKTHMPAGNRIFPDDVITDQPLRFIAAEEIREKILKYTREEIPYSVAVLIDEFKEEKDHPTRIRATVYVERNSQKGILIGKGGGMLKRVGTEARRDLEDLLGTKVFLEVWVKVQKDWRQNESFLTELGY
ncbi:MAG TPA: GTPase Era [Nitrospiria bacterium]